MAKEKELQKLYSEYHNTDMDQDVFEARVDALLEDVEELDDLDWRYEVKPVEDEESGSILPPWWKHVLIGLIVLALIIFTKGLILRFLIPIVIVVLIGYAAWHISQIGEQ